jgi:hypothetical protein
MSAAVASGSSVIYWYEEDKVQVMSNANLKSDPAYGLMVLPHCPVLGLSGNKWYPCLVLFQDRGKLKVYLIYIF